MAYNSGRAIKQDQRRASFVLNRELLRPGEISGVTRLVKFVFDYVVWNQHVSSQEQANKCEPINLAVERAELLI